LSDGVFTFTPDATREEAERLVLGVNNTVQREKSRNSFERPIMRLAIFGWSLATGLASSASLFSCRRQNQALFEPGGEREIFRWHVGKPGTAAHLDASAPVAGNCTKA